jgi:hypothetical protein
MPYVSNVRRLLAQYALTGSLPAIAGGAGDTTTTYTNVTRKGRAFVKPPLITGNLPSGQPEASSESVQPQRLSEGAAEKRMR